MKIKGIATIAVAVLNCQNIGFYSAYKYLFLLGGSYPYNSHVPQWLDAWVSYAFLNNFIVGVITVIYLTILGILYLRSKPLKEATG